MALVFIDGFGGYSVAAHSDGAGDDMLMQYIGYTSVTTVALASDNNGERNYVTMILGADMDLDLGSFSDSTFTIGFRFWHTGTSINLVAQFFNGSAQVVGSLGVIANRLVYSASTSQITSNIALHSTQLLRPNQWNYVEMSVTVHASAGTVDFAINNVAAGSVTGVDTQANAGPVTDIRFGADASSNWSTGNRIADLYVDDGLTFLGPMEIWYQEADAAGTESAWTPLASTNQSQVDELGSDEDTTYNSSSVAGDTDSLGTTKTLDEDPLAIQPMGHARVVNPGTATLRFGTKSDPGGTPTESLGATVGLGDTYAGVRGLIDETDPDTAAAWTAANADAADIMYEHVA